MFRAETSPHRDYGTATAESPNLRKPSSNAPKAVVIVNLSRSLSRFRSLSAARSLHSMSRTCARSLARSHRRARRRKRRPERKCPLRRCSLARPTSTQPSTTRAFRPPIRRGSRLARAPSRSSRRSGTSRRSSMSRRRRKPTPPDFGLWGRVCCKFFVLCLWLCIFVHLWLAF